MRPRGEHLVGFGFGTGGAADLVASPEQGVDDMAADEAGGAGDEDVAGRLCEMCIVLVLVIDRPWVWHGLRLRMC